MIPYLTRRAVHSAVALLGLLIAVLRPGRASAAVGSLSLRESNHMTCSVYP